MDDGAFYQPGEVIAGRYQLDEKLAEGGFAVVYSGVRLEDGLRVAVKALKRKALDTDHAALIRLEREAKVAETLDHPNTVKLIDHGTSADGRLYLVMELLRGERLDEAIKRGVGYAPANVHAIMTQLLGALGELHDLGLVHRDIKPANIFVCDPDRYGRPGEVWVKVMDYGFVKVLSGGALGEASSSNLTHDGVILGTPGYLAPESCQGAPISPQADLYAVGLIGYELLTGQPAYQGSRMAKIQAQLQGNPPPLADTLRTFKVAGVIERLMERDPKRRYAAAHEALAELEAITDPHARRKLKTAWWHFW